MKLQFRYITLMTDSQTITITPYEWVSEDISKKLVIRIWGLNENSQRNLITLHGFKCCLYIKLPSVIKGRSIIWDSSKADIFMKYVKWKSLIYNYKFLDNYKVTKFTGNKPIPMVKVNFESISDRKKFYYTNNKAVSYGNFGVFTVKLLEFDISPTRNITSVLKIGSCDWIYINVRKVSGSNKITTIEHEYIGNWKSIKKIDNSITINWTINPSTMSIDIECHSFTERGFPNPCNDRDSMFMVSCVHQMLGLEETTKKYVILMGECNEIPEEDTEIILVNSEAELVEEMFKLFVIHETVMIIGYNIFKFDIPYIATRYEMGYAGITENLNLPHLSPLKSKPTTIYEKKWNSSAYGDVIIMSFEAEGTFCFDLYSMIVREYKLRKYTLDFVSDFFIGDNKVPLPVKEMFKIFREQQQYLHLDRLIETVKDIGHISMKPSSNTVKKINNITRRFKKYYDSTSNPKEIYKHIVNNEFCEKYEPILETIKQKSLSDMSSFVIYCLKDSILPIKIMNKIGIYSRMISTANICGINPSKVYMSGQQVGTYSIIYEFAHENKLIIEKPTLANNGYKGGSVCKPKIGLNKTTCTLDFNSLFPSIIIAYNLCYTTFISKSKLKFYKKDSYRTIKISDEEEYYIIKQEVFEGFIPQLLKKLLAERKAVRVPVNSLKGEKSKAIEDGNISRAKEIDFLLMNINSRQLALKIICNSAYGFTGVSLEKGIMPYIPIATCTTKISRELIKQVGNFIEDKYDSKLIYGDTDSVMMSLPEDYKEAYRIAKSMEDDLNGIPKGGKDFRGEEYPNGKSSLFLPGLRIELERIMYRMICITPKYYAFIEYNDKGILPKETVEDSLGKRERYSMIIKGAPPAKKGTSIFVSNFYKAICETIFNGGNYMKCLEVYEIFILDLLNGLIKPEELSEVVKIGKSYKLENNALRLFKSCLSYRGREVIPGDRIEYIIVKNDCQYKGQKMYMLEELDDNPSLKIDYARYLSNNIKTIDTLINNMFKEYVDEMSDFKFKLNNKTINLKNGISQCMFKYYEAGNDIRDFGDDLYDYIHNV